MENPLANVKVGDWLIMKRVYGGVRCYDSPKQVTRIIKTRIICGEDRYTLEGYAQNTGRFNTNRMVPYTEEIKTFILHENKVRAFFSVLRKIESDQKAIQNSSNEELDSLTTQLSAILDRGK